VHQPQKQAFTGAVRPHDHGAGAAPDLEINIKEQAVPIGFKSEPAGLKKDLSLIGQCRNGWSGRGVLYKITHRQLSERMRARS
jgi:hypothetical protein